MKKLFPKDKQSDMIIGVVIIICLLLNTNIFSFMPSSVVMLALAVFAAAFGLFAVLIWRESPKDEREAQLLMGSDRLGFLAGAIVLSVALVVAGLRHQSTSLLALCLSVMVLGKLFGKYIQK
jgi:cobalamin synthase